VATSRKRSRQRRQQLSIEPLTSNDLVFDAMVRHQTGVLRMASGVGRSVNRILDATERDIRRAIRDRVGSAGFESPAQVKRLESLLAEIVAIRGPAWADASAVMMGEAFQFAIAEPDLIDRIVRTVLPVQIDSTLPGARRLRAIVTRRPFEGRVLRQWAQKLERDDIARIQGQIRIGLIQGETPPQIARRVVGSARLRGRNGVTQITRQQAESIILTANNHIANQARREYYRENDDILSQELYTATLDASTTPICRRWDGHIFPIGKGPIPPLHFRCRSLRSPVFDGEVLGQRPSKPATERMLLREYAKANNLDRVPLKRAALPRGHKGAFDKFSRVRVRELIGRVPAKTTYQQWLTSQSSAFQNDILGPTRAKLFRDGNLTLDRFVTAQGRELTLAELAVRDASAFRAAGLDPADFTRHRAA